MCTFSVFSPKVEEFATRRDKTHELKQPPGIASLEDVAMQVLKKTLTRSSCKSSRLLEEVAAGFQDYLNKQLKAVWTSSPKSSRRLKQVAASPQDYLSK